MSLTLRNIKGAKLTIEEMDNNLIYLQSLGLSGLTHEIPSGGTSGQVLLKTDSTNYNIEWSDKDFTYTQIERLKELVYENGTINLSVSPSTFEKNLDSGTTITYTYSLTLNDDELISATFDSMNVSGSPTDNYSYYNIIDNITKQYSVSLDRNGETINLTSNKTSTALTPIYYGYSDSGNTDYSGNSYTVLNSSLTKQLSGTLRMTIPSGQYGYFLSTGSRMTVYDNDSETNYTPESIFVEDYGKDNGYGKSITVEYENGDTYTLYQYIVNTTLADYDFSLVSYSG